MWVASSRSVAVLTINQLRSFLFLGSRGCRVVSLPLAPSCDSSAAVAVLCRYPKFSPLQSTSACSALLPTRAGRALNRRLAIYSWWGQLSSCCPLSPTLSKVRRSIRCYCCFCRRCCRCRCRCRRRCRRCRCRYRRCPNQASATHFVSLHGPWTKHMHLQRKHFTVCGCIRGSTYDNRQYI